MKQVIVAGCGPAGMMAAIAAAEAGAAVTVLEAMDKPGKKLLLTGNGRCNLTNLDPGLPWRYHSWDYPGNSLDMLPGNSRKNISDISENKSLEPVYSLKKETGDYITKNNISETMKVKTPELIKEVLRQFSVSDTLEFFSSLGLLTTVRDGCVYPASNQSSSVLELLLAQMRRRRIKLKCGEKIRRIEKKGDQWIVYTETWNYSCDSLILCCGSKAVPSTGSDGSGYELARQAGHSLVPVLPALTALRGRDQRFFARCAGVRCPTRVRLFVEDQFFASEQGELQLTESGISGIVVFQLSRHAAQAMEQGKKVYALLNLVPDMEKEALLHYLKQAGERWQKTEVSVLTALSSLLPRKLLSVLLEQCKIRPSAPVCRIAPEQWDDLANELSAFRVSITGCRGFDQCQVCAGGIPLAEIHSRTLESRLAKGLYFAGELLDVDGPCGGYNLQWAWSSGMVAGRYAGV